jgi:hypothetical protein
MPRYKLRTLLILLAVGPPVLTVAWFGWQEVVAAYYAQREIDHAALISGPGMGPLKHYGGGATAPEMPELLSNPQLADE